MADHAGAAADVAFGQWAGNGGVECGDCMLRGDRETGAVAQPPVIGFGDYGEVKRLWRTLPHRQRTDRVTHDAHRVGVGDAERCAEKALLGEPGHSGHLAVAVERVGTGEHRVGPDTVARPDRGHASAHGCGRFRDQCGVADSDAGHIGDRVPGARRQRAGDDPKITQPGSGHIDVPLRRASRTVSGSAIPPGAIGSA